MTNIQNAYNKLSKLSLNQETETAIQNIMGELALSEFTSGLEATTNYSKNSI